MIRFRLSIPALLLAGLLFIPLSGCKSETREGAGSGRTNVAPPVPNPAPEVLATQTAFIEVAEKVTPSVVNIQAARMSRGPGPGSLFEDFLNELFRGHAPPRPRTLSLGSGVIISTDGYILTNEHVVRGAGEIKVKLSDEQTYDAKVVGSDPRTDVAVLKIEAREKLPTAVFGDSDALRVGQWALAIGNPFGLDRTLTVGVISGTGRTNIGIEDYEDFIQTDASINPGNSGGPLLNIYGEVIGINTAIVASGQGIGFAIPINMARTVADQLITTGRVVRGWLGVGTQDLSAELAGSFGLDRAAGALINRVEPDSPARKAGLRRGDILLELNGRPIHNAADLQTRIAGIPAGRTVTVRIQRDGQPLTVKVTIEPRPRERAGQRQSLGLTLVATKGNTGIEVQHVDPRGIGAAAGVRAGDIIVAINRSRLTDLHSFDQALEEARKGPIVRLLIQRGDASLYLALPATAWNADSGLR